MTPATTAAPGRGETLEEDRPCTPAVASMSAAGTMESSARITSGGQGPRVKTHPSAV